MDLKERLRVNFFCVVILASFSLSENFELRSTPSVIGNVGQDAVLPCYISTGSEPPSMELQWKKMDVDTFIIVYQFTALTDKEIFGQGYQKRTTLAKDRVATGDVSLNLKKVQVADAGTYNCIVKSRNWSSVTQTVLKVSAIGNVSIEILGPEGEGIKLACLSSGWFPKPELQWIAKNSQNQLLEVKQDREHLFSIWSTVTVMKDTGEIVCLVDEKSLLQTKQKFTILLSRNIFPHTSPWLSAFWVLFTVALLGFGIVGYFIYKENQKKHAEEKERLIHENQIKSLEAEKHNLQQCLERAETELDFRKAQSYRVHVPLDPNDKHPELALTKDKRMCPDVASTLPGALIILGKEGFKDGGQYWEVRVEDKPEWELGVMSETMRHKLKTGTPDASQEGGCWSLRRSYNKYLPEEADWAIQMFTYKPALIGIYLDGEEERAIKFYDVQGMKAIVKIPVPSCELLYPFFSPGHSEVGDNAKFLIFCQDRDRGFLAQLEAQTDSPQLPDFKNNEKTEITNKATKKKTSKGLFPFFKKQMKSSTVENNEEESAHLHTVSC